MLALRIAGIRLRGYHGVYEREARDGGNFEIELEGECFEPQDTFSDNLADRVDYESLSGRVRELFLEPRCRLIEPVAVRIAESVLQEFPQFLNITVRLRKLDPPMAVTVDFAEVAVTRAR